MDNDAVDGAGTRMSGRVLAASPTGLEVECASLSVEEQPGTRLVLEKKQGTAAMAVAPRLPTTTWLTKFSTSISTNTSPTTWL